MKDGNQPQQNCRDSNCVAIQWRRAAHSQLEQVFRSNSILRTESFCRFVTFLSLDNIHGLVLVSAYTAVQCKLSDSVAQYVSSSPSRRDYSIQGRCCIKDLKKHCLRYNKYKMTPVCQKSQYFGLTACKSPPIQTHLPLESFVQCLCTICAYSLCECLNTPPWLCY